MANKIAIETVTRMLKNLRRNRLFGGVIFLFAGDSRLTLPVVTKGKREDEVNVYLKRSVL